MLAAPIDEEPHRPVTEWPAAIEAQYVSETGRKDASYGLACPVIPSKHEAGVAQHPRIMVFDDCVERLLLAPLGAGNDLSIR